MPIWHILSVNKITRKRYWSLDFTWNIWKKFSYEVEQVLNCLFVGHGDADMALASLSVCLDEGIDKQVVFILPNCIHWDITRWITDGYLVYAARWVVYASKLCSPTVVQRLCLDSWCICPSPWDNSKTKLLIFLTTNWTNWTNLGYAHKYFKLRIIRIERILSHLIRVIRG